ncbi:cytochrome b [Sciscionella sediminilitoris]|uniref:cytochrome bc1 complex cytochrome b subunit n=1 Tax=Sciscionella sediminilitoris TaxID=1445613 RepID=UPI0004DF789A|nr:cytochrome bc complex cytochrome b subunit [Sciscionella sp. SE31]
MSSLTTPTKTAGVALKQAGKAADELDSRLTLAKGMRRQLNKVFPTHWSFMLGEVALYSFIILLLSGTYLALFFDPSMQEVTYNGSFTGLRGVDMSRAYESTLNISFDVRGGLFVRQLHHWAALLFVASMVAHLCRIFFTGAFRRPRETNWFVGALLLVIGMFEGFTGYSLPDDLLSGIGVRAAVSGGILSVPLIGTWLHWLIFGGEFPGQDFIPRFYTIHILVFPGILLGLIAVHLALVWYQKHTQFPGVRRKENNVVGVRIMPVFAAKGGSFFAVVLGVLAIMSGIFQINPVWNIGPYSTGKVSAGSQPDWYMAWFDGLLRIWPDWEIYLGNYTIPAVFPGLVVIGLVIGLTVMYPVIERKLSKDNAHHNLLQRPRDAPVRTALGALAITFYAVMFISCANDIIAFKFDISLNAMTWGGRILLLIGPPIAYWVTYRICLGLQRSDRAVLEHGIETGIIKRLPHGEFIEVHQPLGGTDEHGHAIPLEYQGASVPKKMNELGYTGKGISGIWRAADLPEETAALERARAEQHEHTENGHSGNGQSESESEQLSGRSTE